MTPTYNSKIAIQYHTIYNNCPLFLLLAKHPLPLLPQIRPLRQVANKGHGYIYSTLATYFYAGIYLHADINGHRPRRHNLVPLSYIIWSKFRIHLTLKYYTILCSQHNHCCVMYKILLTVLPPKSCVCVAIPFCPEHLAREPASKGHTGGRSRKSA